MDVFLYVILGGRVETDHPAVERLVEFKVLVSSGPPCPQRLSRRGEISSAWTLRIFGQVFSSRF